MDDLLTVLQLGCSVQLDKRQAVSLGTFIKQLQEQNASLFGQLETAKKQVNDKQLEIEHCHACCDELRGKLTAAIADALDKEADLILAAPAIGDGWTEIENKLALKIGTMMKTRAALVRAGGV